MIKNEENKILVDIFLTRFLRKYKKEEINVVGIIGFGSRFSGLSLRADSDLDIFLIIKDTGKRFRGVLNVNGIDVDYFANPLRQVKVLWDEYTKGLSTSSTIASILSEGFILRDDFGDLAYLQEKAKSFVLKIKKENVPKGIQLIMNRYFIRDYIQNIEGSLKDGDMFCWQQNYNQVLVYLVDIYCASHKLSIKKSIYKKEIFLDKHKKFFDSYLNVADANSLEEKTEKIKILAKIVVDDLGGDLSSEWDIVSEI